jgi:hypothetical protein
MALKCNIFSPCYLLRYRTKSKYKVIQKQNGVVRTNCLDCLDRTNVFQTKVCLKVFLDILKDEPGIVDIQNLMI